MAQIPDVLISLILSYGKFPSEVLSELREDIVKNAMRISSLKEIESLSCYYILYYEEESYSDHVKNVISLHSSLLQAKKRIVLQRESKACYIVPFEMDEELDEKVKYFLQGKNLFRQTGYPYQINKGDFDKNFSDPYDLEKEMDGALCYKHIFTGQDDTLTVLPFKFRSLQHRADFITTKHSLQPYIRKFLKSNVKFHNIFDGKNASVDTFPSECIDMTEVTPSGEEESDVDTFSSECIDMTEVTPSGEEESDLGKK